MKPTTKASDREEDSTQGVIVTSPAATSGDTHSSVSQRSSTSSPDRPGLTSRRAATSRPSRTAAACKADLSERKSFHPRKVLQDQDIILPVFVKRNRVKLSEQLHEIQLSRSVGSSHIFPDYIQSSNIAREACRNTTPLRSLGVGIGHQGSNIYIFRKGPKK